LRYRKTQKIAPNFFQPVNLPADELGVRALARAQCERFLLSEKAGLDRGVMRVLKSLVLMGQRHAPAQSIHTAAVAGVRAEIGRGIDCLALTMSVEWLRERLQQLRCRALAASAESDRERQFIAQRFGALRSAKSRYRR
jgi:hypothetical protein